MLLLDAWWFQSGGIVLCWDPITYEYKGYIKDFNTRQGPMGTVPEGSSDEEEDMLEIASWGNKIPKGALVSFFPGLVLDETKPAQEVNPGYFL